MTTEEILEAIDKADAAAVDQYLYAAMERRQELYANAKVCFFALPLGEKEREKACWYLMRLVLSTFLGGRPKKCNSSFDF